MNAAQEPDRRSGRREPRPSRALWLPVALLALLVAAACQAPVTRWFAYPEDARFAGQPDSLGLAEFLALPTGARQARRAAADGWRARAAAAPSLTEALQGLHTAVGLNPADAAAWLQLALRRRWFGDYQQAEDALAACRAALPHHAGPRRPLAAEAALCEGWLRYDRGEWRRGLAAADSAAAHGGDRDAVDLLRALHLAGLGRDSRAREIALRFAGRDHRAHWIYGVAFWRRGGAQAAHGVFTGTGSEVLAGAADFVKGQMRPTTVAAAECYRDFGTLEEILGNWWLAARNYAHSAAAVPFRDRAVLSRVDHPILGRGPRAPSLPIWLAYGRYYVTGSLSAYTALALSRFETVADAAERDFWAAAVLDAAGTCVRSDLHTPWARRARGLVLVTFQGQQARARQDLEAAQRWFANQRIDDLQTLATLGRLYLEIDRPGRAQPLLQRAAQIPPQSAVVWSDLALSHIQLGQPEPAMKALERALELDDALAVAWYNRGLLRYHLEDLAGAVADLERAHALAPADADILSLLNQLRRALPAPEPR